MALQQPFSRDSASTRDFRIRLNSVTSLLFITFQMVRVPAFREWQRELLRTSIPSELADELTPRELRLRRPSLAIPVSPIVNFNDG